MINFCKDKDKIAIIAPSSKTPDCETKIKAVANLLEQLGFQLSISENIFSNDCLSFFAASKEARLTVIKQALEDPSVKIIWAFRGGYGSTEIVEECMGIKSSGPKILIGFSDITALHLLFNQYYKFPTIHGSVLTSLLDKQSSMLDYCLDIISGDDIEISMEGLNKATFGREICGELTGGNLNVFCKLIGTKLHPDTNNKIIILEDIDERGYEIHRYLIHAKNAGLFHNVKAVIFGDFTATDEFAEVAIEDFCAKYLQDIPCFRLKGFGHGVINYPVIFGAKTAISKDAILRIENNLFSKGLK